MVSVWNNNSSKSFSINLTRQNLISLNLDLVLRWNIEPTSAFPTVVGLHLLPMVYASTDRHQALPHFWGKRSFPERLWISNFHGGVYWENQGQNWLAIWLKLQNWALPSWLFCNWIVILLVIILNWSYSIKEIPNWAISCRLSWGTHLIDSSFSSCLRISYFVHGICQHW